MQFDIMHWMPDAEIDLAGGSIGLFSAWLLTMDTSETTAFGALVALGTALGIALLRLIRFLVGKLVERKIDTRKIDKATGSLERVEQTAERNAQDIQQIKQSQDKIIQLLENRNVENHNG